MNALAKPTRFAYRTPREAFEATRTNYASIQARLEARMVARADEFARGNQEWALVSEEQELITRLATALAMLGDRSAVDELEIAY